MKWLIYTDAELKDKIYEMLKDFETEVVEFKEANNSYSFKDIGKYFSALGNEANIRGAIRYLVRKINRKYPGLDFEPFTPHGLRHTFATKAIEKGMRPKTLQKILGHKSLQMTMDLYCHVEEHTLKEEMALIGKVV